MESTLVSVPIVEPTKIYTGELLSHDAFPSLKSATALDAVLEQQVRDNWIPEIDETNYKFLGLVCDFNHTIAYLIEHYRSMLEHGVVKSEVVEFLESNPTTTGYHIAPGFDVLLSKWADLCGALVIITNRDFKFFPIIHAVMAELNIPPNKYRILSSSGTTYGEALKREMNGLNGLRYAVVSNNAFNLVSFQKAFPEKLQRLALYQGDFLLNTV